MFEKDYHKEEFTVTLNPPMSEILCTSTAYENTVVLIRRNQTAWKYSIVHLTSQGHIHYQRNYNQPIGQFGMIDDHKVIVLNILESTIDIIDLKAMQVFLIPHGYYYSTRDRIKLITFSQTRLFCVIEHNKNSTIKLSYYQYDQPYKKQTEWTGSLEDFNNQYNVQKMNNHSKVGWWDFEPLPYIKFHYFHLKQNLNGKHSVVKTAERAISPKEIKYKQFFGVNYIWEIKPEIYFLAAFSIDQIDKIIYSSSEETNNHYLIDATLSPQESSLQKINFNCDSVESFIYQTPVPDSLDLSKQLVFHTFKHKNGKIIMTPLYTQKNNQGEIYYRGQSQTVSYFFPAWKDFCFIQSIHRSTNCKSITVRTHKIVDKFRTRMASLHLLLNINEDFDDDLLSDAVNLLSEE